MPGFFGVVGCPELCRERLRVEFEAVWGESDAIDVPDGVLGGHAHPPARSCYRHEGATVFAVDGEAGIYQAAKTQEADPGSHAWRILGDELKIECPSEGNVAAARPNEGRWWVAAGLTGIFPVYYSTAAGGLMFSTLLLPLARAIESATPLHHDLLGLLERMRSGYMLAGRTCFKEIRRLLPGQCLVYDSQGDRVMIHESRSPWSEDIPAIPALHSDATGAADTYWEALCTTVDRMTASGRAALMMSGGWDSRTILAALWKIGAKDTLCSTHGDPQSREAAITRRIVQQSGAPLIEEPLLAGVYEPTYIDTYFPRTETAAFPHWLQAGSTLAGRSAARVASGVCGEVVGGHYSGATPNRGARKLTYVGKMLLGGRLSGDGRPLDLPAVRDLLSPPPRAKPWYLSQDFWGAALSQEDTVTADTQQALERLITRGAVDQDRLIEAFLVEHRAAQHIGEQVVSCRASVDVSVPFTDASLLGLAAAIPAALKVQNSLNRLMLLRHAPAFARFPTAATLVPASAPVLLQEGSRLLRRTTDSNRWRLHFLSKGALPFPRPSWWQVEFLRDGVVFGDLLDDLRSEIWDREAIRARITANAEDRIRIDWRSPTALLSQHMMRIATIDRLVR